LDEGGDSQSQAVVIAPPAETLPMPQPPRRGPGRPRKERLPDGSFAPATPMLGPVVDAEVKKEVRKFQPYMGDDPRRLLYNERMTAIRQFVEREMNVPLNRKRVSVVKQIVDLARFTLQGWAAGVKLDLSDVSEAKSLTTAAAILAYIDKFNQVLGQAEATMERAAPEEYAKLTKALENRNNDAT
jgi:hypothetical protein